MKFIIAETNRRLLFANREITANYEIDKTINSLESIDMKSFFILLDKIRAIV
jgi:hypothetical protein